MTTIPAAHAQVLPPLDPAGFVQQAGKDLQDVATQVSADVNGAVAGAQSGIGTQATDVDAALRAALPPAVNYADAIAASNPEPLGIATLERLTQQGDKPLVADVNYVWKNDLFSKIAAMKPTADFVLHRVPGSFFDAPRIPEDSFGAFNRHHSLYGPGTPLYVGENTMCTLTVAGVDATGHKVGLTAAHCGEVGQQVVSADSWQVGPTGTIVKKNPKLDYALVQFNDKAEISNEYGGVRAVKLGGGIRPGEMTCKRGLATGTTCGVVLASDARSMLTHVCAMPGDSGAPLFKDGRVIGAVSGGLINLPCRTPWQGPLHASTGANNIDAVLADLNRLGGVGAGFSLV